MTTFTNAGGSFALTQGTPIIARVRAINSASPGTSTWSNDNTQYGVAQYGPSTQPSGGQSGGSTSETVIEITWSAISLG